MATIQRPLKLYGTRKYVDEVAADPDHKAPILSAEVDADLDAIYAAWNGGVDSINIKPGVITTDHLLDGSVTDPKITGLSWGKLTGVPASFPTAPGSINTASLADGAVTGAKIADGSIGVNDIADGNVSRAKLQVNSCNGNAVYWPSPTGFILGTPNVWTNYGTGQSLTTRGGWVHLHACPGSVIAGGANAGVSNTRWIRDGVHIIAGPWTVGNTAGALVPLPGINWIDVSAAAGTHFYMYQVAVGVNCTILSDSTGAGGFLAVEVG